MRIPKREFPVKFTGYDFGPTQGLLERFSTYQNEGLAPATARHLDEVAAAKGSAPQSGIDILMNAVDPHYKKIVALGAAWSQLDQASRRNYPVIVMSLDLTGGDRADMKKGMVLTNPRLKVVDATPHRWVDYCLTVPGWGSEYDSPTTVKISADELPEAVLLSKDATRVAFHEVVGHLKGMNSIKLAIKQRRRLFYRPPEDQEIWIEMRNAGQLSKWPWQIDLSRGGFSYAKFRREVLDLEKYMKFRNKL